MKRPRPRALAVLVLLAVLSSPVLAAAGPAKSCDPGYGPPADRIAACAGGFSDPARLASAFQAKLGLSADIAGLLAQAVAQRHALEDDLGNRGRDQNLEPAIQKLESRFISLLRQAAGSDAVAVEAGWFYASARREPRFVPDPALFDVIRTAADPARLAKKLIEPVDGEAAGQTAQIVLAALDVRPADFSLWEMAARAAPVMSWTLAFRDEAFRTAEAAASPDASRLAAAWLSELLEDGLTRQAFTVYQGLAPDLRTRVERGVPASVDKESPDLLSGLAAAAFLEGDAAAARRLASLPVPPSGKLSSGKKAVRIAVSAFRRRLLERTFKSSSDDPFDLFATSLGQSRPWSGLDGTGNLFLARLAAREKYPALTAYELRNVASALRYAAEPFEPARGIPPHVRANAAALAAEWSALAESLEGEARAAEDAARTGDGADPAAATIARLLRTPVPAAFEEHPLPADVPLLDTTDEAAEQQLATAAKGLSPPAGVCLARVEREGLRVAAIVSSQGYDPTGEISSGAYWVLLSADGGATWSDPLYTGLRINQPYVVRPVSALPLFAGDHLHVEVEVRELDPAKITFPPIGLAPKRTARGLYLDVPLETLTRDSDGDGLTDLAEARLLTDPASPDTDGDGIPDGADPLPTVRESDASDKRSPAALALAAFVESMRGAGGRALIEGLGAPLLCCSAKNKTQGPEKVLFFTGDRSLFAALHPSLRIVVLTRDEQKEAERRFGPFYPTDVQLFFLDRTGRHAFLLWSAGWQGGIVRLDEKGEKWTAKEVGGWIT